MQTFDAAVLRTALPFDALIPALRAAFASHGTSVPARHVHTLGQGTAHAGTVTYVSPTRRHAAGRG